MKNTLYILIFLVLSVAFSSCTKTETSGFEDAEISLKSKVDPESGGIDSITEEETVKSDKLNRGGGDFQDEITDDDEDDDESTTVSSK